VTDTDGQPLAPMGDPLPDDAARLLERYPHRDGYLLQLFRVFANSTRFLRKGVPNLLDKESPLSLREREIVTLRVTAQLDCEYEWGVHVTAFAEAAGLTPAQVEATRLGDESSPVWSSDEALLVEVVDALCRDATLSDAVRRRFQRSWDAAQQLEILAVAGTYHTVSYVARVARLPGEAFGARFPDAG